MVRSWSMERCRTFPALSPSRRGGLLVAVPELSLRIGCSPVLTAVHRRRPCEAAQNVSPDQNGAGPADAWELTRR